MNRLSRGLRLLTELPKSAQLRRPQCSWEDIASQAVSLGGGVLNPLQNKSEICGFLEEIESVRPRYLLEIGTAQGGNLFMLARACVPNAHIISVDLPHGEGGGGYPAWKIPFFRRLLLPGQRGSFIRADSHAIETLHQVAGALKGNPLDVLFIDGDHSYEGVKRDFEMYSELVRPGGIIGFHDIVPPKLHMEIEVSRLWSEIRTANRSKEFVDDWNQEGMGIGMLTR